MTNRIKAWTAFCVSAASALTALTTLLRCAAEKEEMQAAIQALAEVAFR